MSVEPLPKQEEYDRGYNLKGYKRNPLDYFGFAHIDEESVQLSYHCRGCNQLMGCTLKEWLANEIFAYAYCMSCREGVL